MMIIQQDRKKQLEPSPSSQHTRPKEKSTPNSLPPSPLLPCQVSFVFSISLASTTLPSPCYIYSLKGSHTHQPLIIPFLFSSVELTMSASPEFYKPSPPPCGSPLLADACDNEGYYCRTPTDAEIKEPATCPPAPRKPRPPPRKRLFDVQVLSLRSEELDRLFRPRPQCDKRRRSPDKRAPPSDHQQA